ncbi:MAG: NRDE family protein [Deltaproteobacteria bacterium]
MCLVLFAYDCHPRYKLVMAANRDEFYERPALPAGFWYDDPDILAGRDLREGGTWMGITRGGRFAVLTNYRDPSRFKAERKSRGHLVQDYLSSELDPRSYIDSLGNTTTDYNGFNLLFGSTRSLFYYSNQQEELHPVNAGIHGLSNALLDDPWPKVTKGRGALEEIIRKELFALEDIYQMMADREQPHDQDLPQTGVGLEMERILGPAFVTSPNYGTRVTTLLLVDHQDRVHYHERSFVPIECRISGEVHFDLSPLP